MRCSVRVTSTPVLIPVLCCAKQAPELKHKRVILFSSDEPDKKANAALLITLYAVSLGYSDAGML